MKTKLPLLVFTGIVVALTLFALACAGATEPTSTPIPPAPPAPPVAPTAVPQPTATPVPGAPTQILPTATPTRALPTATPAVSSTGPQYGGTLRFAHLLHIDNLDPAYNSLAGAFQVFYAVYGSLLRVDLKTGNFIPDLAESWDFSTDGKTITFHLRRGVKFQDGTDFNATAVKWNYDRFLDPTQLSPRRGELTPFLDKVEVVDDSTVRFQLKTPSRPFLAQLATDRMGYLSSPAAVQKYGGGIGGNYGRNPVSTGPFMFKDWIPDDHATLVKSPSYWDKGKPYLDSIFMQGTKDASVRLAMLRTGETDIIYAFEVVAKDVPILQRQTDLQVTPIPGSTTAILNFNASKPPFDKEALRQAISYSIDRDKFLQLQYSGAGKPAHTLIAAGWANNPDLKPISFDLAKAKQKLAEAGYPNGATIPFGCAPSGIYFDFCEIIQAMLKDAGITADIKFLNATDYFTTTDKGWFGAVGFGVSSWGYRVDPHILLQGLLHKDGFKVLGTYNNPTLSKMIDDAATVYDLAKAKPLYDQIQTTGATTALAPALVWGNQFQAMNKRVMNFLPNPQVFEHLEFLWLQK